MEGAHLRPGVYKAGITCQIMADWSVTVGLALNWVLSLFCVTLFTSLKPWEVCKLFALLFVPFSHLL